MSERTRHERITALFSDATRRPPAERRAFLERESGGDPSLVAEVLSLLEHHDAPKVPLATGVIDLAGFISALPADPMGEEAAAERDAAGVRTAVGAAVAAAPRYTILGTLGEGGMGTVYLAAQDRPRRTVALKVMRTGFASAERLRKRFEREAELLGRLEHPGIARIYDAGTAEIAAPGGTSTVPYFAMEYVDGLPLLRHAEANHLGTRERMRLMAQIGDAVGAAHRQGIVHRDLKPANILVDRSGQPKVLDFGVARATDADLAVTTVQSDVGQLIGTLAYMSPEQVAGDPTKIDARSDVYALGVLTWELLAGRPLVDARERTMPEIARTIRDEDASRLSSIDRTFRGDLETIVAKALDKDPARRYRDANEFASDIGRYLNDQPIEARPPTTLYQFGKFARRNRVLVGGVVATFIVLVLGLVGTSVGLAQARRERNDALLAQAQADRRFSELRKLAKTFIYEFDDLIMDLPGSTLARQKIVSTATEYLEGLAGEAQDDAGLLMELSEGFMRVGNTQGYHSKANLGDRDGAMRSFRRALELRQQVVALDPEGIEGYAALARTQNAIGNLQFSRNELDAALVTLNGVLDARRELLRRDPQGRERRRDVYVSQSFIGNVERQKATEAANAGRKEEAERYLEQALATYTAALEMAREAYSEDEPRSVRDLSVAEEKVGDALGDLRRYDEALVRYRESLRIRTVLREKDPSNAEYLADLAASYSKVGGQLVNQKRFEEAEPLLLESLRLCHEGEQADEANVLAKINTVVGEYRLALLYSGRAADTERSTAERRSWLESGLAQITKAKGTLESLAAEDRLEENKRSWIPAMEQLRADLAQRMAEFR